MSSSTPPRRIGDTSTPSTRASGTAAAAAVTASNVDLAGGGALLHRPETADDLPELAALGGVLDRHLVGALCRGERAGREREPQQRHRPVGGGRVDLDAALDAAEPDRRPRRSRQARHSDASVTLLLDCLVGGATNHVMSTPPELEATLVENVDRFAQDLVEFLLRSVTRGSL